MSEGGELLLTRQEHEARERVDEITYRCIELQQQATYEDMEFLLNRIEELEYLCHVADGADVMFALKVGRRA